MTLAQERSFHVNAYQLGAKEWHPEASIKVLALHGWLDNAASFDVLAPMLNHCHIVALDMPGHGMSDHKPPQAQYNIWDDLLDVLAVADELGWQKFHLLGHSRGALMCSLLSAAVPERVHSFLLLDAILPLAVPASDAPKQLGGFLRDNRSIDKKRLPCYSSFEEAVAARCRGLLAMEPAAARLIVERGVKVEDGQYYWRSDPRLTFASAFKLTEAHNAAFIKAITVPGLAVLAEEGLGGHTEMVEWLTAFPSLECKIIAGGHHFHMGKEAIVIAKIAARLFVCS